MSMMRFKKKTNKNKSERESCSVVSDSLPPHGLRHTYSLWNSPGQNTRVGSLSLLQQIFLIKKSNWGFLHCSGFFTVEPPGKPKNTGVGSLSLFQGIFPPQGSRPGLPQCRRILYQLSHKGTPRILEWVVYPFSRGSSQPRNQTSVSCIAGGFFTIWAMREVHYKLKSARS